MATVKQVFVQNLNTTDFGLGVEVANKISVALGTGLVRGTSGKWGVDPAFLAASTTNTLTAAGTTVTSTVNGKPAALDIAPAVDAATGDLVKGLAYDATTGIWTITKNDGTTETLSTPVEKYLASTAYNATTNVLTLTMADGSTLAIDLTDLVDGVASDSNRVSASAPMASAQAGTTVTLGELRFRYATNAIRGDLQIQSSSASAVEFRSYGEELYPAQGSLYRAFYLVGTAPATGATWVTIPTGGLGFNEVNRYEIITLNNVYHVKLCAYEANQVHIVVEKAI